MVCTIQTIMFWAFICIFKLAYIWSNQPIFFQFEVGIAAAIHTSIWKKIWKIYEGGITKVLSLRRVYAPAVAGGGDCPFMVIHPTDPRQVLQDSPVKGSGREVMLYGVLWASSATNLWDSVRKPS